MKTLYKNFILLNGKEDMTPLSSLFLLEENGKITYIGNEIVPNDKEIDLNGNYLFPGLINLHVHLPGSGSPKNQSNSKKLVKLIKKYRLFHYIGYLICKKNAKDELMSGVTTSRLVGGIDDLDTIVRDQINKGKIIGPRLFVANQALAPKEGHMLGTVSVEVNNQEDVKKEIDHLLSQKVDFIKLMITGGVLDALEVGHPGVLKMDPELVKFACDYAHEHHLKVAAHVESKEGIKVAINGGVDTIEHGAELTTELIETIKKHHSSIVLTLSPALCVDRVLPKEKQDNENIHINTDVIKNEMIKGAKMAMENDLSLGLGTDVGCPYIKHYDTYREAIYFHKYLNVSPSYALHKLTLGNAQILGIENETGSIEVNKSADFIVLEDNPLTNMMTLSKPLKVVFKGHLYNSPYVKKDRFVEETLNSFLKTI